MITSTGPLGTLILKDKDNNIIYSYNLKEGENLLIKKLTHSLKVEYSFIYKEDTKISCVSSLFFKKINESNLLKT